MTPRHALIAELTHTLVSQVQDHIKNGRTDEALGLCDRIKSTYGQMLETTDQLLGLPKRPAWGNISGMN